MAYTSISAAHPTEAITRADFRCLHFVATSPHAPTIVWLHGIGERGDDLSMVLRFGLPAALAERRMTTNAHVICPQLEDGLAWQAERVERLLSELLTQYSTLALIGFSWGAQGVCDVLAQCGPIADFHVAIAGRARGPASVSQAKTRFLAVSGELDPRPRMLEFVRSLISRGGIAKEVVMPEHGHFISELALLEPELQNGLRRIGISLGMTNGS